VVHVDVQPGQVVEPADHLFEVVDLSTVWVKIAVLEKDLARTAVGQPVEGRLAAYPEPGAVFRAPLQVKGLSLDPKTHQGTLWAELSNPPGQAPRLLPGMSGQAQILLRGRAKVMTVPATALIRDGAETSVLVEEGPGQYVRRYVVVGRQAEGRVEVQA